MLSLLGFKPRQVSCIPKRKDCNASTIMADFSTVELFQKMCTGKSWCGLRAWDTAGSDCLRLTGFVGSALHGDGERWKGSWLC